MILPGREKKNTVAFFPTSDLECISGDVKESKTAALVHECSHAYGTVKKYTAARISLCFIFIPEVPHPSNSVV